MPSAFAVTCRPGNFHKRERSTACRAIERLQGIREEIDKAIAANINNCLTETKLSGYGKPTVGKVRDTYRRDGYIIIVTTDRQSAFDRLLASIPFKGQVLNQTAAWWFEQTNQISPNALVATPDPCISIMRECTVFPVEFVVRGYMTGSTETSLWTHYKNGVRNYCGNPLPEGLVKNQKLEANIITPTTKSATRDVPISPHEIIDQGLMSEEEWLQASTAALQLFQAGQAAAAERGLLLVDTKYELGKDSDGKLAVLDEVHTPDSSRYWLSDTYEERLQEAQEPQNIDKEFLRLWFRDNCDPYHDATLPEAPVDLVSELSRRYIYLYERITGLSFEVPSEGSSASVNERLQANLDSWWSSHVQP